MNPEKLLPIKLFYINGNTHVFYLKVIKINNLLKETVVHFSKKWIKERIKEQVPLYLRMNKIESSVHYYEYSLQGTYENKRHFLNKKDEIRHEWGIINLK